MCDLYLALPDKLLIWCYQNNLFSLKCFFIPPSLTLRLSLSFLFYFLLCPLSPSPPSISPFCTWSFLFSYALSLAWTLSCSHFCLSSLFISPHLSCPLTLFLHLLVPLAHMLSLSSSICCLGNNDSCVLVFCIFWKYKQLWWQKLLPD